MREIKFRFLRTDINGDKFWEYRIFPDDLYNNDWSDLGANFSTLSQYTGLKDKNGKEIYEGDIVKGKFNNIGVIEWEEKNACFTRFYPLCDFDVIGNIFENPEFINHPLT